MTDLNTETPIFDRVVARLSRPRQESHLVIIVTRYGETDRECYCDATDGEMHHEHDHAWVTADGTVSHR